MGEWLEGCKVLKMAEGALTQKMLVDIEKRQRNRVLPRRFSTKSSSSTTSEWNKHLYKQYNGVSMAYEVIRA